MTFTLSALLGQDVSAMRLIAFDRTRGFNFEALGGASIGLYFGHFSILRIHIF